MSTITATFNGGRYAETTSLYQWDYGITLKIAGLTLPTAYEAHFANDPGYGDVITMIGNADGVKIPNVLLQSGRPVYCWIYLTTETSGRTKYQITIPVIVRPQTEDDTPTPEQQSAIDQAIAALDDAVEQTGRDAASAAESARNAGISEENALASERNAAASEGAAHDSEVNAAASARSASESEIAAGASEDNAAASERNAALSESAASGYAVDAGASARAASASEDNAAGSARDASGYANAASGSATAAETDALKAEGFAVGEQGGEAVGSGSPYYHNNAEYYSDQAGSSATSASGSATSAETNALKAEGYAVGKQNGTDVGDTSPYYHNNAEYYATEAAASARDAAESAASAAQSASVFVIDPTLTHSGQAADAKVTGDELASVKSDLSDLEGANASIENLAGLAGNRNIVVPPNTVKKQILLFDLVANRQVTITVTRATALNVSTYLYVYDANGNDILGNSRSFPAANTSYSFQFTPQSDYKNAVLLYSVASSATSNVLITSVVATWDSYFAANKSVGYSMACIAPSVYNGGYPRIDTANNTFTILGGSVIVDRRCENGKYYYISQDTTVDYSGVIDRVVFFWDVENNNLLARSYTNNGHPIPDTYLIVAIYNRTSGAISSSIPVMIDGLLYGITVASTDEQPVEVEAEYNATRKSNEEVFTAERVSYLFITDLHVDYFPQQTDFSRNQLKIVADMANSSDVDFVVLGGDYIDGTGTKDTATQYLRFITDGIRNCQKPVLVCRGNHDKNNNGSQESTEYVTTEDFYAIMQAPFRRLEFMYDTEATGTELYYYYDVPGKNTRVIVYDSIFNDRPSEMMKWLCEKALTKKEAGWKYIVVTHVPFNNKYNTGGMTWVGQYGQQMESIISALNNRTTYTGTAGTYAIDVDFTDYLSNVVAISTGHQHTDLVTWDTNTDCFFSTTGCATPAGGQGTFNDSTMQPDGEQTSGRNNMDIDNPNKYLFDLFSVTDASMTRSRFGNGVDKTVVKP